MNIKLTPPQKKTDAYLAKSHIDDIHFTIVLIAAFIQ